MSSKPAANDSRSRPSFGDAAESAEFVQMLEKFERGAKLPVTGEATGRTLRELVARAGHG